MMLSNVQLFASIHTVFFVNISWENPSLLFRMWSTIFLLLALLFSTQVVIWSYLYDSYLCSPSKVCLSLHGWPKGSLNTAFVRKPSVTRHWDQPRGQERVFSSCTLTPPSDALSALLQTPPHPHPPSLNGLALMTGKMIVSLQTMRSWRHCTSPCRHCTSPCRLLEN